MKCKFLGLVAIMAAICLICSCGNGSGDSENTAPKTVALSFAVNTENGALRTITVDFEGIDVDTYEYKATALFTSEFGTPQGDTGDAWVEFDPDEAAGEFAQGKWQFEVRCLQDDVVVYQTAEAVETYINASITTVEVTVVRQFAEGDGTLIIDDVTAPEYSEWEAAEAGKCDYLVITGGPNEITIYSSGTTDYRSTFADEGIDVAAGIYTMTFTVYDKDDNAVGAATKVVEIGVGLETTVSGALDSGVWVSESIAIVEKTIELEVTDPTEAVECEQGDEIPFTFTGTIKVGDNAVEDEDITYTLYYNGSSVDVGSEVSGTAVTFGWDTADVAPGYYYVRIVASYSNAETGETLTTDGETTILVTVKPAE